jgi:hypothetical protein
MKFGKTYTNKLISFADRYFTWDKRTMRRENTDSTFDFWAISRENGHTVSVCIDRNSYGLWVSIRKDDEYIIGEHLKSYSDVTNFKRMIKCLS